MSKSVSKSRSKAIAGVVGVLALVVLGITAWNILPRTSNQGYAPEQPIPFSHRLHAGQYKMDCKYCHSQVEFSRHASVPSVNVCMNCHRVVKTDSPHIQKIWAAYNNQQPIEWVRVHELPDFAYFPHNRHVAKGLQCQTCHGPVQEMERIYQYSPLTMGWCMECHKGRSTPKNVKHLQESLKAHEGGLVAPVQCSTCHY